jgi:hypothetical protein
VTSARRARAPSCCGEGCASLRRISSPFCQPRAASTSRIAKPSHTAAASPQGRRLGGSQNHPAWSPCLES